MKVIISHDVDHLTVWEHKGDLIIPKFWIRSFIELTIGKISLVELYYRLKDFIKNRWNNIEELVQFNKANNIPATFFFGVNKGLGLSYHYEEAKSYIEFVKNNGFDIGVHGIEYYNFKGIKKEFELFRNISGLNKFGIRMHYLRWNETTLQLLSKAGYLFDSTLYIEKNPWKVDNLWEFPLHIMDGFILLGRRRYQSLTLNQALDLTKRKIDTLYKKGIRYLTILFHDRYFSNSFITWREWYISTIEFLKSNKFRFINYKQAIKELEELVQ